MTCPVLNLMEPQPLAASFRDPAGFVFERGNALFRLVSEEGLDDFNAFVASGLAAELAASGRLVPFEVAGAAAPSRLELALEKLPFISYPYEWSFHQLRDAALLTLDLELAALDYGLTLKDASAYNVGWKNGRPIFLDHGSFTRYRLDEPWRAYRQFVEHFFAPLTLAHYLDSGIVQKLRIDPAGIGLDFAAKLLPSRSYFSLSTLVNIHLHARFDRKWSDSRRPVAFEPRLPRAKLQAMLRCLRDAVASLTPKKDGTEWENYYFDNSYSSAGFDFKRRMIADFCNRVKPRTVVDFGANTGVFSQLAAAAGAVVVAPDCDPHAVDALYVTAAERKQRIYPLVQNFSNPSPGIGLDNRERSPFADRATGDAAFALALAHHLRISDNWPLERIVKFFAAAAPLAVVEFVPKSDPQVQRLLRSRPDIADDWTADAFLTAFRRRFTVKQVLPVPDSDRLLLELEKNPL